MKTLITEFWNKNKVFILGLIGSIGISLQDYISKPAVDYKIIAFAAFLAIISYFAKEWRGQGLSITGVIGSAAGVFITMQQSNTFTWQQFILQTIVLIITTAVPDPKSRGYENTPAILEAKKQGEEINPASLTNKP